MKKIILFAICSIILTGCNNNSQISTTYNPQDIQTTTTENNRKGLFLIDEERQIYSDFTNPKMMLDGKVVSVKEISKTNCTTSCIYNYSEPTTIYKDGGSRLFSYTIDEQTYYVVECHKINGNRDTIISKSKDIVNRC